jgi:hypothetical protein
LAKYRIAKLHSAMADEYDRIEHARGAIVQRLGSEQFSDAEKTKSIGWGFPDGEEGSAAKQYLEEWKALRATVIEVNVTPITLESLGNELRGIEANEFQMLEKFIIETAVTA